jgi:hypothetical protein
MKDLRQVVLVSNGARIVAFAGCVALGLLGLQPFALGDVVTRLVPALLIAVPLWIPMRTMRSATLDPRWPGFGAVRRLEIASAALWMTPLFLWATGIVGETPWLGVPLVAGAGLALASDVLAARAPAAAWRTSAGSSWPRVAAAWVAAFVLAAVLPYAYEYWLR